MHGIQKAAINFKYKSIFDQSTNRTSGGFTNVTFEDYATNKLCNESNNKPHDQNSYSTNCNANRLFNARIGDGILELNIYQDLVYFICKRYWETGFDGWWDGAITQWKTYHPKIATQEKLQNAQISPSNIEWINKRHISDGKLLGIKIEKTNSKLKHYELDATLAFLGHRILGLNGSVKADNQSMSNSQLAWKYTPEFVDRFFNYALRHALHFHAFDPSAFAFSSIREGQEVEKKVAIQIKSGTVRGTTTMGLKYNNGNGENITTAFDGWWDVTDWMKASLGTSVPRFIDRFLRDISAIYPIYRKAGIFEYLKSSIF